MSQEQNGSGLESQVPKPPRWAVWIGTILVGLALILFIFNTVLRPQVDDFWGWWQSLGGNNGGGSKVVIENKDKKLCGGIAADACDKLKDRYEEKGEN